MEKSEIIEFEDGMIVCICDKIFYVTGLSISTPYDREFSIGRKEVSISGTNGLSVSFVCTDKELEDLPSMRRLIGRKERKVSYPGEYLGSSTDILVHIGKWGATRNFYQTAHHPMISLFFAKKAKAKHL